MNAINDYAPVYGWLALDCPSSRTGRKPTTESGQALVQGPGLSCGDHGVRCARAGLPLFPGGHHNDHLSDPRNDLIVSQHFLAVDGS